MDSEPAVAPGPAPAREPGPAKASPAALATGADERLRLDGMLRELGAHEGEDEPPPTRRAAITVGELVDKAAEGGFGFLTAVLALLAIPFVGFSTPFGLAIALGGIQLFAGRHRPWLPARTRRRQLRMAMLDRVLGMITRRTRWVARASRPRWPALVTPRLVGLGIVLLGLGLALPLPIPGSNLVFIVPLLVYSVGLLERDGIWIAVAHLATLVNLGLVIAFGATIVAVLSGLVRYLS